MAHHDLRVEWVKQRVCAGFRLTDCDCFDQLLSRDDGEAEDKVTRYLNVVVEEPSWACLVFFLDLSETEDEHVSVGEAGGSDSEISLRLDPDNLASNNTL